MEKIDDLISIFNYTELYTGKLSQINNIKTEYNILYRCVIHDNYLYYLLYDYKSLYYNKQVFEHIIKLNKELNPSLEFNDVNGLVSFLIDNIFKAENNLLITQSDNEFKFEIIVDIIKVHWSLKCEKLNLHDNLNNFEIAQNLFAKPVINLLFSFQQFLTNEKSITQNKTGLTTNNPRNDIYTGDVNLYIGNLYTNRQKNFNKNLITLTAESTKCINSAKEKDHMNKNLKRKGSSPDKMKIDHKKKRDNSRERDKSSEKLFSESEDDKSSKAGFSISKPGEKKKKAKLKFV